MFHEKVCFNFVTKSFKIDLSSEFIRKFVDSFRSKLSSKFPRSFKIVLSSEFIRKFVDSFRSKLSSKFPRSFRRKVKVNSF
jgi:predicted DNA-binding protein (UPF0278 family)